MAVGGTALMMRATTRVQGNYKSNEQWGFCDAPVVDPAVHNVKGVFLKVAALG